MSDLEVRLGDPYVPPQWRTVFSNEIRWDIAESAPACKTLVRPLPDPTRPHVITYR